MALSCYGIAVAVGVDCTAADVGYIVGCIHTRVVHHVGIGIGQIDTLGPVWLYSDGCHAVGHVEVGTLVEYAFTLAVFVLFGAVAVGEVVGGGGDNT